MTNHLVAIVLVVATTVIAASVSLAIWATGENRRTQPAVPLDAHGKPQNSPPLPHLRC